MPWPPACCTSSAVSSIVSGRLYSERCVRVVRPVRYTVAPAAPSSIAMPRPAPRVAPATNATLPLRTWLIIQLSLARFRLGLMPRADLRGQALFGCGKSYALFQRRARHFYALLSEKRDRSMSDRSRFHSFFYGRVERMRAEVCDIAGTFVSRAANGAAPRSAIPRSGAANSKVSTAHRTAAHYAATERARRSSPGLDSDRPKHLHVRRSRNSSDRGLQSLPVLPHDLIKLDDRPTVPPIHRRIGLGSIPVQPSDLWSAGLITQPGPFLPFHYPQFTDHPIHGRFPLHDRPAVFPQQQVGKLQRVFHEPHLLINRGHQRGRSPGTLLMTPVLFLDQRRAGPFMQARAIDCAGPFLQQSISQSVQVSRRVTHRRFQDHQGAALMQEIKETVDQLGAPLDWIARRTKELTQRIREDDQLIPLPPARREIVQALAPLKVGLQGKKAGFRRDRHQRVAVPQPFRIKESLPRLVHRDCLDRPLEARRLMT